MKQLQLIVFISLLCACGNPGWEQKASGTDTAIAILKDSILKSTILYDTAEYIVLDSATGNLNTDAYPDKILILKNKDEANAPNLKRPLLILTGQADGTYKKAAQNDKVVLCADCGGIYGDPYQRVIIKDGYFSVEHYGGSAWRWTRIITFKYFEPKGQWLLHKDAGISYHNSDPDKTEDIIHNINDYNKLPFEAFDNEKGF